MLDNTRAALAVEATGLALIFLLLLPSIHRLIKITRTGTKKDSFGVYEDVDGAATEKSQAEYSVKYAQIAVCATTAVGLATSIASAVMSTMRHTNVKAFMVTITLDWLLSLAWVSYFHHFPSSLRSQNTYSTPACQKYLRSCLIYQIPSRGFHCKEAKRRSNHYGQFMFGIAKPPCQCEIFYSVWASNIA